MIDDWTWDQGWRRSPVLRVHVDDGADVDRIVARHRARVHTGGPDELPAEVVESYLAPPRRLPDGCWIGMMRLLAHWTLHVDIHATGYEERYCYHDFPQLMRNFMRWDGLGDPTHWTRHPETGRRWDPSTNERWHYW